MQTVIEFEKARSERKGKILTLKLSRNITYNRVYAIMEKHNYNVLRFDATLKKHKILVVQHIRINNEYAGKRHRSVIQTFLKNEAGKITEQLLENENDIACIRISFLGGKDEKGKSCYLASIHGTVNPFEGVDAKVFSCMVV